MASVQKTPAVTRVETVEIEPATVTLTLSEREATVLYNLLYRGVGGISPERSLMSDLGITLEGAGMEYDYTFRILGNASLQPLAGRV